MHEHFGAGLLRRLNIRGLVVSANLCTSPCSSDYIFAQRSGRLAYSLWGFRLEGSHRSFDVSNDGCPSERPFLLIIRTERIFTSRHESGQ
jgi:hypothetical protein